MSVIFDGPLMDRLKIPARRKVVHFDVAKHKINPLHGMDYRRAREFIAVLDAVLPYRACPWRSADCAASQ